MDIKYMQKLLEKKSLSFSSKIVDEQLAIMVKEVINEKLIQKYIKNITVVIKKADFKEFNISEDEFKKLLSGKSVEEHAYMIMYDDINKLRDTVLLLQNILKSQKEGARNFVEEKQCYDVIQKITTEISLSKKQIEDYLLDIQKLSYSKDFMNGQRVLSKVIKNLLFRVHISGVENIPQNGPCIIAPRHYNALFDPIILHAIVPRKLFFLASVETFIPWGKMRNILNRLGLIPYKRNDAKFGPRLDTAVPKKEIDNYPSNNPESIKTLLLHLKYGEVIVIFPQGEAIILPTYDNNGQSFLPTDDGFISVALLAQKLYGRKIPIIPIGLKYRREDTDVLSVTNMSKIAIKLQAIRTVFQTVTVKVGEPIIIDSSEDISKSNEKIYSIIKELSR